MSNMEKVACIVLNIFHLLVEVLCAHMYIYFKSGLLHYSKYVNKSKRLRVVELYHTNLYQTTNLSYFLIYFIEGVVVKEL